MGWFCALRTLEIKRGLLREAPRGAEKPSAKAVRPGVRRNSESVCPVEPAASMGRMDWALAPKVQAVNKALTLSKKKREKTYTILLVFKLRVSVERVEKRE
jgi:hypothetical protein